MGRSEPSVVEDHGLYAHSCGYCKSNARTSVSYGLLAHRLSSDDYQDLLDRGWRRSGKLLYRPEMEKTCCPAYTIRLKVTSFCKSKEQTRVMHRMQRYLDGTYNGPPYKEEVNRESKMVLESHKNSGSEDCNVSITNKVAGTNAGDMDCSESGGTYCETKEKGECKETDTIARNLSTAVEAAIKSCMMCGEYPTDLQIPKIVIQRAKPSLKRRTKTSSGEVCYTCNIAFVCAAAVLKHKKTHEIVMNVSQQSSRGHEVQDKKNEGTDPVMLAESIALKLQNNNGVLNFKVEACKGHLNFLSGDVEVDSSNQVSVDADGLPSTSAVKSGHLLSPRPGHTQVKRKLEIRMRSSCFDPVEFALYKKYQIAIHHDKPEDVKESSYRRFLVDTPLTPSDEGPDFCGFGSFHQQYLIDGHLVAVGVVDILPSCLSSKYLFWDPDLAFLSLGKYSALAEIEWVKEAQKYCPSMQYYYLGYYIHSCHKMRYKASYRPSELLCPVRFQWVPVDIATRVLDRQPYVCLSDYLNATAMQRFAKDILKRGKLSATIFEDVSNDEPRDMDLGEVEIERQVEAAQSVEIASSSKESEDVSNVLLKLGNQYLLFKRLQAWSGVPQKDLDALVCNLRKYCLAVGHILAARMAYALG